MLKRKIENDSEEKQRKEEEEKRISARTKANMEEMKKEFEAVVERQMGNILREIKKVRKENEQNASVDSQLAEIREKYKKNKETLRNKEKEMHEKEEKIEELEVANQKLDERATLLMDLTRRQEATINMQKDKIDRMAKQIKMFERYFMDPEEFSEKKQQTQQPQQSQQPQQKRTQQKRTESPLYTLYPGQPSSFRISEQVILFPRKFSRGAIIDFEHKFSLGRENFGL